MRILSCTLLVFHFLSCAGPTNPFGGNIFISEKFSTQGKIKDDNVEISYSPDRQYYNSPYDLKINIIDPDFDIQHFRYDIVYNHKKLNRWFKSEEIIFPKKKTDPIQVLFKNLSILAGNINKIDFLYYPKGSTTAVTYGLKVPVCLKKYTPTPVNIHPFTISYDLKNTISSISKEYNYHPSLTHALIAQESSFNPKAISISKALGLTQITPRAHEEIKKYKEDWSIYPNYSKLSLSKIKTALQKNTINPKNDWRLDQKKSIEGAMLYLDYIQSYWKTPDKKKILFEAFKNNIPEIDILLASYNSGAYRVKKAILESKKYWLSDSSLSEARKYTMNVKSFCYSFSNSKKAKEVK